MNENKTINKSLWLIITIILALIVGIGCFLLGKNQEKSKYIKEQELSVALNRTELEALGDIEGPIYVTGHKSPDTDTVGSCIAYARLLQKLGYDAKPVVLGRINNESKYVLEKAGIEAPELLEDASGCNMVLVDHSEFEQSADGLSDANIISIIDHHSDGSVKTGNRLIYDARPLGSTATIVWMRYRNYGIDIDKDTALAMIGSIYSDTEALSNDTVTFADEEAVKALSEIAGTSNLDTFWDEMHEAALSYEGMTDEEILENDYKEYECAGVHYGIGVIKASDKETAMDIAGRMEKALTSVKSSHGMDMVFAQIRYDDGEDTYTYILPSDDVAAEVLKAGFSETWEFDGKGYLTSPSVSRKSGIVPVITEVLNQFPHE